MEKMDRMEKRREIEKENHLSKKGKKRGLKPFCISSI